MYRPGGHFIVTSDEGEQWTDTFTCGHCNAVVAVPVKQQAADIGGLCKQCMKLICPGCVTRGHCDPLEEKLRRAEARHEALRSYGV